MTLGWGMWNDGIGNELGYATHDRALRAALEAEGVTIAREGPVTVWLTPPYFFRPRRMTRNVLYSMFEFEQLPDEWKIFLDIADLVVVPCEHNRRLFQEYTARPVEVCHEGVDTRWFPLAERRFPADGEPFVFLYVGANNPRKGTWHVAKAWELFNEAHPDIGDRVQLVMKMTDGGKDGLEQIASNAFADWRLLPKTFEEARASGLPLIGSVYHYAHAFLFPSMGEGFGLTLAEAMATGLPCIYTPHSGPEDFVNEEDAYPVYYGRRELRLCDNLGRYYGNVACADPDPAHVAERMWEIYTHYDEALARGKRAARHIRQFTWGRSARRLLEILRTHFGEEAAA